MRVGAAPVRHKPHRQPAAARTSKKRVRRPPTIRQPRDFQLNGLPVFKLKNSEDSKILKPKPEICSHIK